MTPSLKAGAGTAAIQVTPGTWPDGINGTCLTKLTLSRDGAAKESLALEYDESAKAYQEVSFSFANETAEYTFGVDTAEIPGFDLSCYELLIDGGHSEDGQADRRRRRRRWRWRWRWRNRYLHHYRQRRRARLDQSRRQGLRGGGGGCAFVFAPDNGWQVAEVLVDGVSAGALGSYTFEEVSANHTISVSFEESLSIADPNDTGVSDWLITQDHIRYLGRLRTGPVRSHGQPDPRAGGTDILQPAAGSGCGSDRQLHRRAVRGLVCPGCPYPGLPWHRAGCGRRPL